jgi:hypothetical protein
MPTRRKNNTKKRKMFVKISKKKISKKKVSKNKTRKNGWITAVGAAEETFKKTGSYDKAREKLRIQSIINARKLFSSLNERL